MKLYLAGKITKGDWRVVVAPRVDDPPRAEDSWPPDAFPITHLSIPGVDEHEYVGPYFIACDHGCYHGANRHGIGADGATCGTRPLSQSIVARLCLEAIGRCDVFFAWLDDLSCYGTLVELGYAKALGKRLWVAGPRVPEDLWFSVECAEASRWGIDDPVRALWSMLEPTLAQPLPFSRGRHRSACVYLLRSGDRFKIGFSGNLSARIAQLRTMSAAQVDLILAVAGSEPGRFERRLHQEFAAHRRNGEWFALTPAQVDRACALMRSWGAPVGAL